jgi:hypothetical protein
VQKWRRRDYRSHLETNTRYWNLNRRSRRNIALYGDRRSKTGAGWCAHLEFRFTGAATCGRVGLGNLASIMGGVDTMALLERQAWIAFINCNRLSRVIEQMARNTVRNGRRRSPTITVNAVKSKAQQLLPRCIQDESDPLDWSTITTARSQELWDRLPSFRSCLRDRIEWTNFTPRPAWRRW